MKKYNFKKIDAFTKGQSSGNPAACIYLDTTQDINEKEMQQIAYQLKGYVNEVIYLFPEGEHYLLKYYSSECEVDFCGHGTIAIMYDLIKNKQELLLRDELRIKVKDDLLIVKNDIERTDSVYIYAPAARYLDTTLTSKIVSNSLEISEDQINKEQAIELINAGLNTLIVPLINLEDCLSVYPDQNNLKEFCLKSNIDIILIYTAETYSNDSDFRTRVFAPKFGYLEDPATGSGNSAFGYYLLKHDLWNGSNLTIEQSGNKENPNYVKLNSYNNDSVSQVIFGGSAIVRIEGEYMLY